MIESPVLETTTPATLAVESVRVRSREFPPPANYREFATLEEQDAYGLGVHDGNAAATRVLVGCHYPIRLVVDESLPEGVCELRVRNLKDVAAPTFALGLLRG